VTPEAYTQFEDLTADLAQMHLELGEMVAAEKEQRVRAYEDSGESSVSAADRYADAAVLDLTTEIIKLKSEIRASEVQWEFLMACMRGEG
jgi:hypothetical protein